MEIVPICFECKRYKGEGQCEAFKNIPALIWVEGNDHSEPLPEQENDITFEPIEEE